MTAHVESRTVRALVVEDASAQRGRLVSALEEQGDITVSECCSSSADAVELVARARPDVVVLDLHLHDGRSQQVVELVMAHTPTPILVLSARIADRQAPSAVHALVAGALEALPRPARWTPEQGAELRRTVRQISKAFVIRHPRGGRSSVERNRSDTHGAHEPVVAVAASTGGPSALATVLGGLAGLQAPVLVVQHLHADFTAGLVEWMSRVSALPVEIARHGQRTSPGHVYFAPGERHLRLRPGGVLELVATPITAHRPSADELFHSVADVAGPSGIGVLLTGMGDDGAKGLLAIRQSGGHTLAQDEATSTVFGMPKAALRAGAVTELLPLDRVADAVQRAMREQVRA
ncbi:two-component system, chemotaxis family, protein-glutamate methylesterase/glutaminase [Marmoricola sp. URHA0025 HA25]